MVRSSHLSAPSLRVSTWMLIAGLVVLFLPASLQAEEGREYVDKKAGFRLKVPAGWEKQKIQGMTVAFRGPRTVLSVGAEMAGISPEEYLAATKRNAPGSFTNLRPVSEEEAVVGGLPARKLEYRWEANNAVLRGWFLVVLSQGEYWLLTVAGGDAAWPAEGSPEDAEIQGVIASFEFLEPTLSRLKAGVPPYLMASLPKPGAKIRYFVNDAVGMKVLLPPGWEIGQEQQAGYGKPSIVSLNKPGTLAYLTLKREVLEASPELYGSMAKNSLSTLENFRLLSENKVTVGGLSGFRLELEYKQGGVLYMDWLQIVHSGKDHYVVETGAPKELFGAYKESFEQILNSVRFPGVERGSPSGQAAAVASATAPNSSAGAGASAAPGSELERLKRALEINPNDVEAHVNLGNLLDDSGDRQGAIEEYRAALRLDANHPQAHRNLGLTYWRAGKLKEAEKEEREAVRLKPDYLAARGTLVEILIDRKDYDDAFTELRGAIELDRKSAVDGIRSSLLPVEQEEFDRASVNAVARYSIGVSLLRRNDMDGAAKQLQSAAQEDARFALPHQDLAAIYSTQKKNYAASRAEAQAALQLNPKLPKAHYFLGDVAFFQEKYEEAVVEFQAAAQLRPEMAEAHNSLAKAYFRLQKLNQFLAAALASLSADPKLNPGPLHMLLALVYLTRNDFPLAWQHAEEARRNGADLGPEIMNALTAEYPESKWKGLKDKAEKLRQTTRENAADARRHVELGGALSDTGDFEGSGAEYAKAVSFNPNLASAHNGMGQLAYRKGDASGALGHWQESLRLEPTQADAHLRMARMYAAEEATRLQAAEHFEEFLRRVERAAWPADEIARAYGSLGSIYSNEKVGREKDALLKMEEGLKFYPEHANLLNNTAWLYATSKDLTLRNPQKALAYAVKAVQNSDWKMAAYVDTLAEAYYVNGQFQKAVETEKKALALAPNSESMKKAMEKYERAAKTGRP